MPEVCAYDEVKVAVGSGGASGALTRYFNGWIPLSKLRSNRVSDLTIKTARQAQGHLDQKFTDFRTRAQVELVVG